MSSSTSKLRVWLAQWNRFKPSSKILYWPFQGGTSLVDLFVFCVSCVSHAFASVHCCLVVTCWERAWPLGSCWWCLLYFVSFPCGVLGQVWCLVVSISDFCPPFLFWCRRLVYSVWLWYFLIIPAYILIGVQTVLSIHTDHSTRLIVHCLSYYGINGVLITNILLNLVLWVCFGMSEPIAFIEEAWNVLTL